MSFAKIAETRAVKKIVALLLDEAHRCEAPTSFIVGSLALRIKRGDWRDVKLELEPEPTKLVCSVCGEPQIETRGGATCGNSHGGAEGVALKKGKRRGKKKKD